MAMPDDRDRSDAVILTERRPSGTDTRHVYEPHGDGGWLYHEEQYRDGAWRPAGGGVRVASLAIENAEAVEP